jgi:hypothetical protein
MRASGVTRASRRWWTLRVSPCVSAPNSQCGPSCLIHTIVITHLHSRVGWRDAHACYRARWLRNFRHSPRRKPGTTALTQLFYGYNYNVLTANIRFRTLRNFFPLINAGIFYFAYRYVRYHSVNTERRLPKSTSSINTAGCAPRSLWNRMSISSSMMVHQR